MNETEVNTPEAFIHEMESSVVGEGALGFSSRSKPHSRQKCTWLAFLAHDAFQCTVAAIIHHSIVYV